MTQGSLIEEFVAIVGAENVLTEADAEAPYLLDWRGRYRGKALCVVRPSTT